MFVGLKRYLFCLVLLGPVFVFDTYATLLGDNEPQEPPVTSPSEPIEMPPYQSEYPDSIPEQNVAVPARIIPTGGPSVEAGMVPPTSNDSAIIPKEAPKPVQVQPVVPQEVVVEKPTPPEVVPEPEMVPAVDMPSDNVLEVRIVSPPTTSHILNPNIQEKKKKVPSAAPVQRTGLVDPDLWQKGMEEARRKVETKIRHLDSSDVPSPEEEETVPEEPKEKNIFLRFLQRLTGLFDR